MDQYECNLRLVVSCDGPLAMTTIANAMSGHCRDTLSDDLSRCGVSIDTFHMSAEPIPIVGEKQLWSEMRDSLACDPRFNSRQAMIAVEIVDKFMPADYHQPIQLPTPARTHKP